MLSGITSSVGGIYHDVKKIGFAKGLKKIYTMPGLEKVVLVVIPTLEILKRNIAGTFDIWLDVLKDQYVLYTTVHMIPASHRFLKTPSLTKTWYLLESFWGTAFVLNKHEVIDLAPYFDLTEKLGQFSIFQSNLANHFLKIPKDFFTVLLALSHVATLSKKHYREVLEPKERRKDLLRGVYSIGMIALVIMRSRFSPTGDPLPLGYNILDFATQSANLVRYLIK